jgi:outer membrane protein OmpA-like peptidoglycan-associated protein
VGVLAGTDTTWNAVTDPSFSDYNISFFTAAGVPIDFFGSGGTETGTSDFLPFPIGNSLPNGVDTTPSLTPPYSNGVGIVAEYNPSGSSSPTFATLTPVTKMPIYRFTFPRGSSTVYSSQESDFDQLAILLTTFASSCGLSGAQSINATVTLVGRTNGNVKAERSTALARARVDAVKSALDAVYTGADGVAPLTITTKIDGTKDALGNNHTKKWRQADRSVTLELTTTNSTESSC